MAPAAPYTTYGTCGCIDGDTLVSLFSGETKKASEIEDGDVLLGWVDGEPRAQIVSNRFEFEEPCVSIEHERGRIVCSSTHMLIAQGGGAVTASGLCPGEQSLVSDAGEAVLIRSIANAGVRRVYGWSASPDAVFVAGGVLNHNKVARVPAVLLI